MRLVVGFIPEGAETIDVLASLDVPEDTQAYVEACNGPVVLTISFATLHLDGYPAPVVMSFGLGF
jgi:hypothetical protein